jgi:uncharacterized membrane protein
MDVAVFGSIFRVANEYRTLTSAHGSWMVWNTLLALVPLALAFVVFRPGIRRSPVWWGGVVAFVLFLPNAPYVLTDVVHLFRDIRREDDDLMVLTVYVPTYLVFMAVGFGAYVVSLRRLAAYLGSEGLGRLWVPLFFLLQAGVAVGIYLGRVVRLNSWYVVTAPAEVVGSFEELAGRFPLQVIAVTFVVLVVTTGFTWLALDGSIAWSRQQVPRLRRLLHS